MNIIMATPLLYEKTSPFNHLLKDIIEGILDDGNEMIRIVACENEKEQDYKMDIRHDHISYIKIKRKRTLKGNIIKRYILDNITNLRMAIWILRLHTGDILLEDISYASIWTVLAAKVKGMKVISMLQDVWPDNAVLSGLISRTGILYLVFEFFQRWVYNKSDRIICISPDMKRFVQKKGIAESKIKVIYNWGYSDIPVKISWEENKFVKKFHLNKEYFYAVYAGNIGKMQNVESILVAAEKLKDISYIKFLIIGDGVNRCNIEKKAAGLTNVTLLPMQPPELAVHIYSAATVNLIPLIPGGLQTAMPSKVGVCLSCGKPILFCSDALSDFSDLLDQYQAGYSVEPGQLAFKLKELSKDTKIRYMQKWDLYEKYFSRDKNIKKYVEILKGND